MIHTVKYPSAFIVNTSILGIMLWPNKLVDWNYLSYKIFFKYIEISFMKEVLHILVYKKNSLLHRYAHLSCRCSHWKAAYYGLILHLFHSMRLFKGIRWITEAGNNIVFQVFTNLEWTFTIIKRWKLFLNTKYYCLPLNQVASGCLKYMCMFWK